MELRTFATQIIDGPTLEDKLRPPPEGLAALTDHEPGQAEPWRPPARCDALAIAPKKERKPLPHPSSLHDPAMRIRTLHQFANHELMAVELMAWAILAYPDAPPAFRRGLAWLVVEEQRHTQLYVDRIEQLGGYFGQAPVNDHFWRVGPSLHTPLQWVCAMNLTFEQANLDHAPEFAAHFRDAGDEETAALLEQIELDEIQHVAFGARWLKHLSPKDADLFEQFKRNLTNHHGPARGRAKSSFNEQARRAAGLDESFINAMRSTIQPTSHQGDTT